MYSKIWHLIPKQKVTNGINDRMDLKLTLNSFQGSTDENYCKQKIFSRAWYDICTIIPLALARHNISVRNWKRAFPLTDKCFNFTP